MSFQMKYQPKESYVFTSGPCPLSPCMNSYWGCPEIKESGMRDFDRDLKIDDED